MAIPLIPILLGLGLVAVARSEQRVATGPGLPGSGVAAGPPGSPESMFDQAALNALTEMRPIPGTGQMARYFKAVVVQQILAMISTFSAQDAGGEGTRRYYQLKPIQPGGVLSGRDIAIIAKGMGQAVLASLTIMIPSGEITRALAIVSPADRAVMAQFGTQWAILLDDSIQLPGGLPASPPGGAQIPPSMIPPGVIPPFGSPPGGAQIPPSMIPPGVIPPPFGSPPGGAQIPPSMIPPGLGGGMPPVSPGGLDAGMPASTQTLMRQALADDTIDPAALEAAALEADKGGFSSAATMLRARANDLRVRRQLQAQLQGGVQFKIRKNDTPIFLAKYYGGLSKDLLTANPEIHAETRDSPTTGKPTTFFVPWDIGQTILLPSVWNPTAKPPPPPAPSGSFAAKKAPTPDVPPPVVTPGKPAPLPNA